MSAGQAKSTSAYLITDSRSLATSLRLVFLIKDVRLQRIQIHDVSNTPVPMASIALSPCLLTRDNFDNRSWCTHDLVANKSDLGSLGLRGIRIVIARVPSSRTKSVDDTCTLI